MPLPALWLLVIAYFARVGLGRPKKMDQLGASKVLVVELARSDVVGRPDRARRKKKMQKVPLFIAENAEVAVALNLRQQVPAIETDAQYDLTAWLQDSFSDVLIQNSGVESGAIVPSAAGVTNVGAAANYWASLQLANGAGRGIIKAIEVTLSQKTQQAAQRGAKFVARFSSGISDSFGGTDDSAGAVTRASTTATGLLETNYFTEMSAQFDCPADGGARRFFVLFADRPTGLAKCVLRTGIIEKESSQGLVEPLDIQWQIQNAASGSGLAVTTEACVPGTDSMNRLLAALGVL